MKCIRFILNYRILLLILALVDAQLPAKAQRITVKQDGSGDFTIIQQAVDFSSNGDTVLVWPGIYYENVMIDQKSIVLGSLTLTTNDPDYASQTIIDGNQTGSCIYTYYCQEYTEVHGFTLQHGSGTSLGSNQRWGGGIFFFNSSGAAKNCIIKNNLVPGQGGGISVLDSQVELAGNLIKENHSFLGGGGIYILGSAIFDSSFRNNIYLNYSASGCDIYIVTGHSPAPIQVIVDTFTVQNPDWYYLLATSGLGIPNDEVTCDIQHGKIDPVNDDLFVSTEGDDKNSGLSSDNPLKTIGYALSKIVSDSLHQNTIHLANGIYSFEDGEKFPLNLRSFVSISGQERDSSILDASNVIYHLRGNINTNNFSITNLTIRNGNGDLNSTHEMGSFIFVENHNIRFENLLFTENTGNTGSCGTINLSDNVLLKNVEFYHNHGGKALRVGMGYSLVGLPLNNPDTVQVIQSIFRGNDLDNDSVLATGGGAVVIGNDMVPDSNTCFFTSCLFTGHISDSVDAIGSISLSSHYGGQAFAINCTFADNTWNNPFGEGAPIAVTYGSKLHIYNSILYGNVPAEIYMYTIEDMDNYLDIHNSLLQGGLPGIKVYSPDNYITFDPSNLDTYPEWDTIEPYKYSLLEGSPCIDAGTLDFPPGITLPEFDLAGNPRVWGESVDMGAFEYGPWVAIKENPNSKFKIQNSKLLEVSPNPFTYGTYVSYELKEPGRLNISVYSISGMKVRSLVNNTGSVGDKGNFYWDGRDQNGQAFPSGVYFIRMTVDGKEVETVKAVRE
jgi:hypothetical protein